MKILEIRGWHLNPDELHVLRIKQMLDKIKNKYLYSYCPCKFKEGLSKEDLIEIECPCLEYQEGSGCCCKLYLEDE